MIVRGATVQAGDGHREFHVSRQARERYGLEEALFSLTGNVVFADFRAAREFAHRMNLRRDAARFPERAVSAGHLNAMGLIDEFAHLLVARYRRLSNPRLLADALADLEASIGRAPVDELLLAFVADFPPLAVHRGELTAPAWLAGTTGEERNRELALEELLLLWLANRNPAFAPFRELFDDSGLRLATAYLKVMDRLRAFLAGQPRIEGTPGGLLELLEAPMRAAPDSLEGQLAYLRTAWSVLLGEELARVLSSLDLFAEERRVFFGFGPGPVPVPELRILEDDREAYSEDRDWMPRLVLMAKNVHVWLGQLSERHQRPIATLDAIPDVELDRLASWGVTGLWLIGLWERSRASARIKRMMGDAEAVASAYSLEDYRVAADLGGGDSFAELKARAWRRGIRMATDMVPNHVGIDSRWVIEHPDWFISLDRPPFPSYAFGGPDLCDDGRVGIFIEDHYWDRSDAAVVFRRRDHWTGDERFIYHGNDGTGMPWNDTAQLDYRKPEVREAVIQTILHVARQSPVIRFDAAMTLTKRHFHRLWFPEPGSGGDIPSRAGHGMTRAEFDAAMPEEFWREVVDRVAAEAPDTLLLAEAFWLLEGYFVRTLGMHRVYNSAFMNMLRDERNADYRHLIRSTLEFDPRILKRYVNFMSNPDERTALDQFGKDGKYFGVATLMATLPGLPMFGHGQIEGLAEKYGMEFYRARWSEQPDDELVRRHERQLFPLLRRRRAFAEVERFQLYDLQRKDGGVDENVFAYSNGSGSERSLVLFHNCFAETSGWVRRSCAVQTAPGGGQDTLRHTTLAEALELPAGDEWYVVLADTASGLEYLRSCRSVHEQGLYVELAAYDLHVFADIRPVADWPDRRYARLAGRLDGRGVPSIDEALAELELEPVLEPYRRLVAPDVLRELVEGPAAGVEASPDAAVLDRIEASLEELLGAIHARVGGVAEPELAHEIRNDLEELLAGDRAAALRELWPPPAAGSPLLPAAVVWVLLRRLADGAPQALEEGDVGRWFDDWFLLSNLRRSLLAIGLGAEPSDRAVAAVRTLEACRQWWQSEPTELPDLATTMRDLLAVPAVASFLGVNRYQGVDWFVSECWNDLQFCLAVVAAVESDEPATLAEVGRRLNLLASAKQASGFRVDELLAALAAGPE
jgi:glycosidase